MGEPARKDPVFDKVLQQQIAEKRCACCLHRKVFGIDFGGTIWSCKIGRQWPKSGRCRRFNLDETA